MLFQKKESFFPFSRKKGNTTLCNDTLNAFSARRIHFQERRVVKLGCNRFYSVSVAVVRAEIVGGRDVCAFVPCMY